MTQPFGSPPPYQPYQPYVVYQSPVAPTATVKRASVLMFILGGLLLLMTGCCGLAGFISLDQMPEPNRSEFRKMDDQVRIATNGVGVQDIMKICTVLMLIPAALEIVFGFTVRGGKSGWIITAIVFTSILLLLLACCVGLATLQVLANPQAVAGIIMWGVPASLVGLQLFWLISGLRAIERSRTMAMPQQQGYWPQQPPPGYGYGYGPPAVPPPPPTYPPQQPPSEPPK